jgi:hypothetical protein
MFHAQNSLGDPEEGQVIIGDPVFAYTKAQLLLHSINIIKHFQKSFEPFVIE